MSEGGSRISRQVPRGNSVFGKYSTDKGIRGEML